MVTPTKVKRNSVGKSTYNSKRCLCAFDMPPGARKKTGCRLNGLSAEEEKTFGNTALTWIN